MKLIRNVREIWKYLFLLSLEKVRKIILEVVNYYNYINVVELDKFRMVFRELLLGDMVFFIFFRKVIKIVCSYYICKCVRIFGKFL